MPQFADTEPQQHCANDRSGDQLPAPCTPPRQTGTSSPKRKLDGARAPKHSRITICKLELVSEQEMDGSVREQSLEALHSSSSSNNKATGSCPSTILESVAQPHEAGHIRRESLPVARDEATLRGMDSVPTAPGASVSTPERSTLEEAPVSQLQAAPVDRQPSFYKKKLCSRFQEAKSVPAGALAALTRRRKEEPNTFDGDGKALLQQSLSPNVATLISTKTMPPRLTALVAAPLVSRAAAAAAASSASLGLAASPSSAAAGDCPSETKKEKVSASAVAPSALTAREMSMDSKVDLSREDLCSMEVEAQVDRKFLVVRHCQKRLYVLFDQHAASERVELERLQQRLQEGDDTLLAAEAVEDDHSRLAMTAEELRWAQQHQKKLEQWGFRFSILEEAGGLKVTHVPNLLGTKLSPSSLRNFIAEAEEGAATRVVMPKAFLHILAFKACRRAIKFGDALDDGQMRSLLAALQTCDFPFQCAHGRPTMYPFMDVPSLVMLLEKNSGRLGGSCKRHRPPPLASILGSSLVEDQQRAQGL